MSMNRVASIDAVVATGNDPASRLGSDGSPPQRVRTLSFNPFPDHWDFSAGRRPLQYVAAYQVARWKRIVQIVVTLIYSLLAAGIIFGYAALKPVLRQEGAYRDTCSAKGGSDRDIEVCVEMRLNLMFTVAAVASNVATLPMGAILDNFGPRASNIVGSFLLATGSLLMAYAQEVPFDGLLVGYLLLALGGPGVFISSFQLSNAFPSRSGLILSLITGSFDASSALFYIYRIIYERTAGSLTVQKFFLGYLTVPATIMLLHLFVLPAYPYKSVGELVSMVEEYDSEGYFSDGSVSPFSEEDQSPLLRGNDGRRYASIATEVENLLGSVHSDAFVRREERRNDVSGVWGAMHGASAVQQIRSPWFILISLFTIVQMTRINYFIATIRPQYESILDSIDKAVRLNHFFDAALPIGGLAAVPLVGYFLDNFSTVSVLSTLVAAATAIGALGIVPRLWAAYANIALFVLYRPLYYTAVSDYAAKVFGLHTFGTVYGALITLTGPFNLSQYVLDYLFHVKFDGDPVPVDIMLLSLAAGIGLVLVGYVWWEGKDLRRRLLEREAEAAFEHTSV
ncbi:hypothetical protein jhhlp_007327 [Lomentospora prolificans]|uniref:Nodulin-like domain-containing protein n=1 Tax=Lomentospora prolificans TaxID=41688 RepID=A0A2N3N2C4_9PEZI|nr:hypothetical protein jhhlp_007327 [Lomentospora prolificans]